MTRRALCRNALLIVFGTIIAAAHTLPTASAADVAKQTTVLLGWHGSDCVTITAPDQTTGRATTTTQHVCDPIGQRYTYLARPGQYYGARINAAPGVGVVCEVEHGSSTELFESALGTVDCLRKWM